MSHCFGAKLTGNWTVVRLEGENTLRLGCGSPEKTVGVGGLGGRSEKENKEYCENTPLPTFAHYIDAKVGKKNLLKYSISLVHMPQFLMMFTCEVNDHHDFCSFVHHNKQQLR